MSWIQVRTDESYVTSSPTPYRLRLDVLTARGIDPALFVFRVGDQGYSHPAMVRDLKTFPAGLAAAQAARLDFYRAPGVQLDFLTSAEAVEARDALRARLALVNQDWQAQATAGFGGITLLTYDSGTP